MESRELIREPEGQGYAAPVPWAAAALLASVVDASDDAIVTRDLQGRITSWNRSAERIFGYTASEAVGRPITALIPPERRGEEGEILSKVRAGEAVEHLETVRVAKDGRPVDVLLTVSPLRDDAGRVVGAAGILRDISARREWDRTKLLLAAVVESSDDAIATKGLDGIITSWNKGAERIFGYSAAEIIGRSVLTLIPEERRAEEDAIMARLRAGELVEHFETVRVAKDGRRLDVSLTISPLKDGRGRIFGASKIARDISERRSVERQLAQHRDHLNELVEQRTAELRASEHRLELSERMASLGTLAAGLGHDMGNLLMPVRVRLEAIAAHAPPELRADLRAIEQTTKYLGQLASGLRLLAHDPDAATQTKECTELTGWWAEVMALMRSAVPRGVTVSARVAGAAAVRMSKPALTQAVFNLVQNSGDALRARGTGSVEVWAEPGSGEGSVRLGVSDDGPGMTEEVRKRCLEPFYSTKTRGMSTGLGLSLVQGIVQRAGGSVEISSAVGKGTTVTLEVPAWRRAGDGGDGDCGTGGVRAVAAVTIAEARVGSFARTVLSSMEFEVERESEPGDGAVLWVTDGPPDAGAVSAFLDGDPRRRVVVYGDVPEGIEGPRVAAVKPPFRPTALREQLVRAARAATRGA